MVPTTPKSAVPVGTRRQQQKAETHRLILTSARSLFEAAGFKGTTIRAIANRAGVALGTINAHFPDKESLLAAALVEELEQVLQQFSDSAPQDAPLEEQLLHLVRAGYTFWGKRPDLSRVLLKEMWFLKGPWADRLRALDRHGQQGMVALLVAAQEDGQLRPDADLALAARAGFAFYLTTILHALDSPAYDVEAMIDDTRRFLRQLVAGIGART